MRGQVRSSPARQRPRRSARRGGSRRRPVGSRTGESASDGSVPGDDNVKGQAEAGPGPATASSGSARAGESGDVDPSAVVRLAGHEERPGDGNLPLGDGAEDRDELEGPGLYGETVERDGRDSAGAAVLATPLPPPLEGNAAEPLAVTAPTTVITASADKAGRLLVMCAPIGRVGVDISSVPGGRQGCQRLLLRFRRRAERSCGRWPRR
jgi:hypothetical protein